MFDAVGRSLGPPRPSRAVAALILLSLVAGACRERKDTPAEPHAAAPPPADVPAAPPVAPKLDDATFWSRVNVGVAHFEAGEWDEAAAVFLPLAEEAPERVAAAVDAGHALLAARRYDDALALVDRAIAAHPDSAGLRVLRYRALKSLGREDEAGKALLAAMERAPDDPSLRYLRLQDRYFAGDDAGTWAEAKRLAAALPDNLYVAALAARAAIVAGARDEAGPLLQRARALAGDGPGSAELAAAAGALTGDDAETPARMLRMAQNVLGPTPRCQREREWLSDPATGRLVTGRAEGSAPAAEGPALVAAPGDPWIGRLPAGATPVVAFDDAGDGSAALLLLAPDGAALVTPGGTRALGPHDGAAFVADVDNDGEPEVVTWGPSGLRLGDREGSLLAGAVRAVEPADTDMDGDLDLVTLMGDGRLLIVRNGGEGTFDALPPVVEGVTAFALSDFDGDGAADLAAALPDRLVLLHNGVRAGFAPEGEVPGETVALVPLGAATVERLTGVSVGALRADGTVQRVGVSVLPGGETQVRATPWAIVPCRPGPAAVADLDGDGPAELLVACADDSGRLVIVAGRGGATRVVTVAGPVRALLPFDTDGDRDPDLVVARKGAAGVVLVNPANGPRHRLGLTGTKDNVDAVGARVAVAAGPQQVYRFVTLRAPGVVLGRGRTTVTFGTGGRATVDRDVVTWSNGTYRQHVSPTALDTAFVQPRDQLGSCPNLYVRAGENERYITDFFVNSPIGLPTADGAYWVPDGDEVHPLPDDVVEAAVDGQLRLTLAEDMREVIYLDAVSLVTVRHPADAEVYAEDRIALPVPQRRITAVTDVRPPARAVDAEGRDVTDTLAGADGRFVRGMERLSFPGMCAAHAVTLSFPDLPKDAPLAIVIHGASALTDSGEYALSQARRVVPQPPTWEVRGPSGEWAPLAVDVGMPGGRPKSYAVRLPDGTRPDTLRVSSNYCIYWDRIAVGRVLPDEALQVTETPPAEATLAWRGYATTDHLAEIPAPWDASALVERRGYDFASGYYTRYGDVGPLLAAADDRLAIMSHGDGLSLAFALGEDDARRGGRVTRLIHFRGWVKDADPKTQFGKTVEPIPHLGMTSYESGRPPAEAAGVDVERLRRSWNTRLLRGDGTVESF